MSKYLQAAAIAVLSFALTAPTQAYDTYGETLDARSGDLYAGAYMTFRFGGPRKAQTDDQLKYGFRAGLQAPNRGFLAARRYDLTGRPVQGRQKLKLNLLDTSFDRQGFEKLSLAGAPLVFRGTDGQIYVFSADGQDGDGKSSSALKKVGKAALWTGVVVVGLVAVLALGSCVDGKSKEEQFLDTCPLN